MENGFQEKRDNYGQGDKNGSKNTRMLHLPQNGLDK